MPELPEVEIASRHLRSWWAGRRVEGLELPRTRVLRAQAPSAFAALLGRRLLGVERRGKWLLLSFEGGQGLLSHLGMTGKWVRRPVSAPKTPHARATFLLDDGHALDYRDPRLFGQLEVGPLDALRQRQVLQDLGPEPLAGIDVPRLHEALHGTRRSLKEALMDQTLLAGLGNIHVSESLFRARLWPGRPARSLSLAETAGLARAILASLREAIAAADGPAPITYVEEGGENTFLVYGREGEPCRECGQAIVRVVQGGRSTYFCRRCQPRAKARAKAGANAKAKR